MPSGKRTFHLYLLCSIPRRSGPWDFAGFVRLGCVCNKKLARSRGQACPDYMVVISLESLINKLNALLDDEPDPSPKVVVVWAESLGNGIVPEHILTYAFLRRAQSGRQSEPQVCL